MSFQNRLLLNRATLAKLDNLEVMVLAARGRLDAVSARVVNLGGGVNKQERDVGYLRVTVPTTKLLDLVDTPDIDAYQISTFSRGQWYREGWPELEADAFRNLEVAPLPGPASTTSSLPMLTPEESRAGGYTADAETGVAEWMRDHPTFDGRGVTIALLETGQPDFGSLLSSTAKTIDGHDVPKLAGVVNTLDPDAPDETRVELETSIHAASTWVGIAQRTYIVPRPGAYRFGVFALPGGSNLFQAFGVLEDEESGEIRIDTNGDASFQDETAIADVNDRLDVRFLKVTAPVKRDLSFVIARGSRPHTIHVYCGRSDHQMMTLSVAAGVPSDRTLASGVAPGARVLVVRVLTHRQRVVDFVEGYLSASALAGVDILTDSDGMALAPDTAADFMGVLFARITSTRSKPIFHSAGNEQLVLNAAHYGGGAFSVGGSIGPQTFAALYGGGALDTVIVHPTSSAGPSIDGGVKPDFLAPMQRLSAGAPWTPPVLLPKNAPVKTTGAGYEISCCTSASSPYAAGLAALLVSAARQQHVPWSVASLGRALRMGARFLSNTPSYLQGNGLLDINAAWRELTHPIDVPVIQSTTHVLHPLAAYAAHGTRGQGIFEVGGWLVGATGQRRIELRRESGPAQPVTYRVSWTGNDGTFATAPTLTLPLARTVSLPVTISVSTAGVHSALLNVHDAVSNRIVFRTQATIVAPEPADRATGSVHMIGTLPLMRMRTHYVDVPPGTAALEITINVLRGIVRPTVVPSHTLLPQSEDSPVLGIGPQLGKGSHVGIVLHPAPGMWTLDLLNNAVWQESRRIDGVEAEYAADVRLLRTAIDVRRSLGALTVVHLHNRGSAIRKPVLETSDAIVTSDEATSQTSGLPNFFDLDVPPNASSLLLRTRSTAGGPIEMYLYDCTTGECFLKDFTFPASDEQLLELADPSAGRWKLAINSAPDPAARTRFTVDEIVTVGARHRTPLSRRIGVGETSTDAVAVVPPAGGRTATLYALIDAALEQDVRSNPWDTAPTSRTRIIPRTLAGWTVVPIR